MAGSSSSPGGTMRLLEGSDGGRTKDTTLHARHKRIQRIQRIQLLRGSSSPDLSAGRITYTAKRLENDAGRAIKGCSFRNGGLYI
eukprot:476731-Hanusia_phi.AAC.1